MFVSQKPLCLRETSTITVHREVHTVCVFGTCERANAPLLSAHPPANTKAFVAAWPRPLSTPPFWLCGDTVF